MESDEATRLHTRHRDFYLRLAEEAETAWLTSKQGEMLDRLEADAGNLQAALEWSKQAGDAEALLRLTTALRPYWEVTGRFGEARQWLNEAIARAQMAPDATRANALIAAGLIAAYMGEYERAADCYGESLSLCEEMKDAHGIALATTQLGLLAQTIGDTARAMAYHTDALDRWRALGDISRVAESLLNLGYGAFLSGDSLRAISFFEESRALFGTLDRPRDLADALLSLGFVRFMTGDPAQAFPLLTEGLLLVQKQSDQPLLARGLEEFAFIASMSGEADRAAQLFGAVDELRSAIGVPMLPAYRHFYDQALATLRAALDEAALAAAWEKGREMSAAQAVAYALQGVPGSRPRGAAGKRTLSDRQ